MICEQCPCNRSLWSGTRTLRFVQRTFAEWRRWRFRRSLGSSSILSACDMPSDMILEWLYKSKLKDSVQLQTVVALYGKETVRNNGQTSYSRLKTSVHWSDDENSKLQSPKRSCGKRISHQEWKWKESLRGEQSVRVCWVESTWTMFERRLM